MPDRQSITPTQAEAFVGKMQAEGYSDDEIKSYIRDHVTVEAAPATTPAKSFWDTHPRVAMGVRTALDTLPGIGGIAGAAVASPETLGTGALWGGPLGVGVGQGARDLIADRIGLEHSSPLNKAVRIGEGTALTALGPGAIEALTSPIQTLKEGAEAAEGMASHLVPKSVRQAIRILGSMGGESATSAPRPTASAEPILTRPQWQHNAQILAEEALEKARGGEQKLLGAGPIQLPATSGPDPSFVRSVPAQYAQSERLALPEGKTPIIPPSPDDPSFVRSVPAAKSELPVRDPMTGRMKRVYTSEAGGPKSPQGPEPTPKPPTPAQQPLQASVKALTDDGYGAAEVASKLKDHPEMQGLTETQRVNKVRQVRGGEAGQLPARAKAAIDAAIKTLTTDAEKQAYLLKAGSGPAYNYVKAKLGL